MKIRKVRLMAIIATLLVSVDVIQFSGLRLTLIPLLCYGVYTIYKKRSIDKWLIYVILFAVACLPSVLYSPLQGKSLGYVLWIMFNYLSVSIVYKNLVAADESQAILGVRDAYRIQIIIGAILYFTGIQWRAQVLYYEPSYFALSLTPYIVLVFSAYLKSGRAGATQQKYTSPMDVAFLLVALYTTKSANMLFVFLIAAIVLSLYGKGKFKKIIVMVAMCSVAWLGMSWYSESNNDLISVTFQNLSNSANLFDAAMDRTGNRWPRAQLTFDTAFNTFFGVGIGTFQEYTLTTYLPKFSGMPEYISPLGNEPINIYFEIAATCGWMALAVWLVWHFKLLAEANRDKSSAPIIVCSLIVAMLALFIESNFMRPYYWMLIGMVMGQISYANRHREEGS
ncbi:hypothetical protein BHU62_01620 [Serratia marcescens]|uniref:O-antigen ligase-related domain-containing protein n=2 Tax=Serratia marcescens TaxID=615 RepID=A0A1Q4P6S6_SERMA|nr:hypothetical protein BHU62_01620 [Serratia marcescens]